MGLELHVRRCATLLLIAPSQVIVEMNKTMSPAQGSNIWSWIRGCVFLDVPHGGSKLADWAGILAPLEALTGLLQMGKITNLGQKCAILNRISDEFSQVRHTHSIPVQSCYETKKMGRVYRKFVNPPFFHHA